MLQQTIPFSPSITSDSFVEELALELYTKYGENIDRICLVFPNQRTGLYFKNCLAKLISKPVWAPDVFSIEQFASEVSELSKPDKLSLVFELYEEYRKLSTVEESFDRFYFWGDMILNDFSETDKYKVDARQLFANLKDQHQIDTFFDALSEDQIVVIQSFWRNFTKSRESSERKSFVRLWEILYDLYLNFKKRIENRGHGYEGMIFRNAADKIKAGTYVTECEKIIFAGFNHLNACEEDIVKGLVKQGKAHVYWDVDAYYINNTAQEAGFYLRKYKNDPVLKDTFPKTLPNHFADRTSKKITMIGVPLEVGQAKITGQLLRDLSGDINPQKTVVVMPEESLLFPVLHSIPPEIKHVNVTMGYPMRNTPLYSLIIHLIELQLTASKDHRNRFMFHHKVVLALLRHPYILYYDVEKATHNIEEIERANRVFLRPEHLAKEDDFYNLIFKKVSNVSDAFNYMHDIMLTIVKYVREKDPEAISLEEEYIYQYFTHVNRLKEVISDKKINITNLQTIWKLIRQIADSLRLPFTGEPVQGLQLMGILESRNLDFENVFILSVNEGSFPPKHSNDSFIPYNLRKGFGLPVSENYDAMYAYYFYRLLHKAKKVFFLYNTENANNVSGEMSRFLHQLKFESGLKIKESTPTNTVRIVSPEPIVIEKTSAVQKELSKFLVGKSEKAAAISPSAVNAYLDCPLKFYLKFVAGLQEADEVLEEVDSSVFGSLLHKTMELLYKNLIDRKKSGVVEAKEFELLESEVDKQIAHAFREHYHLDDDSPFTFEGRNIIIRTIIKRYVSTALTRDKEYSPFEILGLEANAREGYRMQLRIEVEGKQETVSLKGTIDRIDCKEDVIRVLDYKTGSDSSDFYGISSLFEADNPKRNKSTMQIIFYGMLYAEKEKDASKKITVGLIMAKRLIDVNFSTAIKNFPPDGEPYTVGDIRPLLPEYKSGLKKVLEEIYNKEIPFIQTTDIKKCSFCSFHGICHKDLQ